MPNTKPTIMFADIAGSTQLYDTVGDAAAEQRISSVIDYMTKCCESHRGIRVKTIGDEILVRFDSAFDALTASNNIQNDVFSKPELSALGLKVRIGLHCGPIIIKDDDVFGDTVNVASRMVNLAQPEQIICSGETLQNLPNLSSFDHRQLSSLNIKGKSAAVDIIEILWRTDDEELTCLMPSSFDSQQDRNSWRAELSYGDEHAYITNQHPKVDLGRSPQCDLKVMTPEVSRNHVNIRSRWGKLVLADTSTNGTYVTINQGEEIFVHMDELTLTEDGIVSLGKPASQNSQHVVHFRFSKP